MALGRDVVDAIIREHSYRPIAGDVLVIGHQTVNLSRNEVLELMREHDVAAASGATQACQKCAASKTARARGTFELLGVGAVRILDAENADIVHDLALPIPQHLRVARISSSTAARFPTYFLPRRRSETMRSMLRAGGRLLAINNLSGHFDPYSIPSPVWYLDYFVVNGFADCKVYILCILPDWPANAFCVDIDCLWIRHVKCERFCRPTRWPILFSPKKRRFDRSRYADPRSPQIGRRVRAIPEESSPDQT